MLIISWGLALQIMPTINSNEQTARMILIFKMCWLNFEKVFDF